MTLKEFEALTDKAVDDMVKLWSERSSPLIRTMFSLKDDSREGAFAATLLTKSNTMLASMACATLMSASQGGPHTVPLMKVFTEQFASTMKLGVEACFNGEVLPKTFEVATGKPVDFDFRDHLKRDNGRASEVGQ